MYQIKKIDSLGESHISFIHPSGLHVCFLPKDFSDYFISLGVDYGSFIREINGIEIPLGTAHFMEHMMFHTADGGDITDCFAAFGANVNAYTTNEFTAYFCYGSSQKYKALETLINMLLHPHFDATVIENEKSIIEQEIAMYRDEPSAAAYMAMMGSLYPSHPIRNDIAGSAESISNINKDLLWNIYRNFYTPANMTLVISGRFNLDRVQKVLDATLPAYAEAPSLITRPAEDIIPAPVKLTLNMAVSRPILAIGYRDPIILSASQQSRRGYLGQMVCNAIFSKSGSLYPSLFEAGLCGKDFDATYEWSYGCAHILVSTSTNKPDATEAFVVEYLSHLAEHLPSETDFIRAKNVVYADCIRVFDAMEDLVMDQMQECMSGEDFFEIPHMISSICYEEFLAFIKTIFGSTPNAIIHLKPKGEQL